MWEDLETKFNSEAKANDLTRQALTGAQAQNAFGAERAASCRTRNGTSGPNNWAINQWPSAINRVRSQMSFRLTMNVAAGTFHFGRRDPGLIEEERTHALDVDDGDDGDTW